MAFDFRAKKFNTTTKWIGLFGGALCLIISTFMMIHKEQSRRAVHSTSTAPSNRDIDVQNLDNIKNLNDRVLELTGENVAK